MNILAFSIARNVLKSESRERERMRAYAKHTDKLCVVMLTRKEHGFTDVVRDGNLEIYPTNSRNRVRMVIDAFMIGKKLITKNGDEKIFVITAQDPLEIGWLSWLLSLVTGARFHVQLHGDYFSSEAWCGHSLLRRMRRFFALVLLRRAPAIRVVSERIKKSLIARGIDATKITVLPIRPELESFLSVARMNGDSGILTFLSLGRLAPEKNILRIIRAFKIVHEKYPHTRLRIVGEGSERNIIASLITTLHLEDVATLIPWVEDVPRELTRAEVFLLASLHEAYALTLIEAMATGIPVVTTDVGCVGDVVKNNEHGTVVYAESDEAYALAIERMVTDSVFRKVCGERGKETAHRLSHHTQEEYTRAWVTAISKAL